jgi:hypothetical protein
MITRCFIQQSEPVKDYTLVVRPGLLIVVGAVWKFRSTETIGQ